MILLKLFFIFFKIGLFAYGGGYTIISLIYHEVVVSNAWLNIKEYYDLISIAQITPGPIAINSATFIGYKVAGFFGSLIATFGVLLPSILIIIVIIIISKKYKSNNDFLKIILKSVIILIFIAAINLLSEIFNLKEFFKNIYENILVDLNFKNFIHKNKNFINIRYFVSFIIFFINLFVLNSKIKIKVYYLMIVSGIFFLLFSFIY
jgi:chromate transporter